MGRVLIEAMASGKPVVATDIMGITSVVRNNVTGFLVKPRDPKAIADAVIKLAQNKELLKQMGVAAKIEFVQNHSYKDTMMVSDIENLHKEILSKKEPR
jgi:glycosyltransferase involved in cell wall biosynthesis